MQLDTLLPLESSDFQLFVDERSVEEAHQLEYSILIVNSSEPLKVSLSWFDPPCTEFSAKVRTLSQCLVFIFIVVLFLTV